MKKKVKFFGNNIEVDCSYCAHSRINNDAQFCTVNKILKNGKCRKFQYNPTMRVPLRSKTMQKFTEEDFSL